MSEEVSTVIAKASAILAATVVALAVTGRSASATEEPSSPISEGVNAQDAAAARPDQPSKMTPDQVRAAIEKAEQRRLEGLAPDPGPSKSLAEQWGVEVIGIRRTSAGYMLDFRFRVLDAEKALPLFDHRIKPYVLTEKTQTKLPVPMAPKVGAFRPTNRGKNIKGDKTYYMVFGNPDRFVKPGEKVSVVIGDFRADNLTVQ